MICGDGDSWTAASGRQLSHKQNER